MGPERPFPVQPGENTPADSSAFSLQSLFLLLFIGSLDFFSYAFYNIDR